MTLRKADIIESIHEKIGLRQNKAADVFESFLEIIKQSLEDGEDVKISGFGKFCILEKNARRGRNPHTSESLIIAQRKIVTFRFSQKLKESLNK
ncbi:MAG TPA: integration host factor subunit alpha [Syntrophales bacterium]|nr:integration host factor subunit alpha [Syntrophales bacterium]HPQ44326.1 integration host factor subunit alpha [Syntrophales bacterium]